MKPSKQMIILLIFGAVVWLAVYLGLNRATDVVKAPVTLFVGGVQITEAGQWIYSEDRSGEKPVATLTPTENEDWNIKYTEEGVLALNGVEITAYYDHLEREVRHYGIYSAGDLTLVPREGSVNVVSLAETSADITERYGIYCYGKLEVNGGGTLKIDNAGGDYAVKGLQLIIGSTVIAEGRLAGLMNVPSVRDGGNAISIDEEGAFVCGEHTLTEPLTAATLTILDGARLIVPENLSLTVDGGITNAAELKNNGTLSITDADTLSDLPKGSGTVKLNGKEYKYDSAEGWKEQQLRQ